MQKKEPLPFIQMFMRKGRLIYSFTVGLLAIASVSNFYAKANAECQPSSASTPVTVSDETSNIPDSRQIVDGANTVIDSSNPGKIKVNLPDSGAVAGTYTNANITVNAQGVVTSVSSGVGSGGFGARIYVNQPEGFGTNSRNVVGATAGTYSGSISNAAITGNYLTNRVTTGGSSGDIGSIVAANEITAFVLKPVWSCLLSPNTTSNVRYWMGLYDTPLNGSNAPTANFAAFRASTSAGDTNYKFVTGDNSGSVTVTDTGVSFTGSTPHQFQVNMTNYPTSVSGLIDGVLVATNTTHLPGASTPLFQSPIVETLTSSAAASDMGYIVCSSDGSFGAGGGAVASVSAADSTLTITPNVGIVTAKISNNVALPGSPTTTTQSPQDNSTKIATTAYVDSAVAAMAGDETKRIGVVQPGRYGGNSFVAYGFAAATTDGTVGTTVTQSNHLLIPVTTAASSGSLAAANMYNSGYQTDVGTLRPVYDAYASISRTTSVRVWICMNTPSLGSTDTPANTMAFRYSTNASDVRWQAYCSNASSQTIVDCGVAPTANTPQHFKIDFSDGVHAKYYINDTLVATITTTLPVASTSQNFGVVITTLTGSAATIYVGRLKASS